MKTTSAWTMALLACVCLTGAGCDMKPGPITVKGRTVKFVQVNAQDDAEVAAVTGLKTAQVNYEYRLSVLRSYYEHIGSVDKSRAAGKELKNLQEAQWFRWEGGPEVVAPEGEAIDKADERSLVESVVSARERYKDALAELHQFYSRKANDFKARLIQRVMERFDFVETYSYFPEAEIPGPELRPVEVIPQADALYAEAIKLYQQGKPLPLITDYRKERRALRLLLQLVQEHHTSTKIALAAYTIGEIYKEYFNEDLRAVKWYERAWQWDPNIPRPARFQAAVVYDLRLQEKDKAVTLYKQVIEHEQFNQSNVAYAYDRIEKLTGRKE